MSLITALLRKIASFLARRFMKVVRIIVGIFMILLGGWFVLAPITQQFFSKQDILQDAPYLWLIVPVGLVQILIGFSVLRPLFRNTSSG